MSMLAAVRLERDQSASAMEEIWRARHADHRPSYIFEQSNEHAADAIPMFF
jgi:hypothetical protein